MHFKQANDKDVENGQSQAHVGWEQKQLLELEKR